MITPYDWNQKLGLGCEARVVHNLVSQTDYRFIYL
jgi:hypothetical protein